MLRDRKVRRNSAIVRRCDLAGKQCGVFAGLPEFHPLLKDVEGRLSALRKAIDNYRGRYRRLTPAEAVAIAGNDYAVWFAPDIKPLNRPATAADVKAGRAIFHLKGRGVVAKLRLPARGTWRKRPKQKAPTCLIVQAERQPDGTTVSSP